MSGHRIPCFVLLIFLIPIAVLADTIILTDGNQIKGRILSATASDVNIRTEDSITQRIAQARIKEIRFVWADVLHMTSGEKRTCKIVNRDGDNLIIVTSDGPSHVPTSDIRLYFYHTVQGITIPELPATGLDFKNEKSFRMVDAGHKWYAGAYGGVHWPPLKKWKDDLVLRTISYFSGGVKSRVFLNRHLAVGGGIEFDHYRVTDRDDSDMNQTMLGLIFYGGAEWIKRIDPSPVTYIFAAFDVGLFLLRGDVWPHSYRDISFNNRSFAVTPSIGIRSFMSDDITLGVEFSYRYAKSGDISITSDPGNSFELDFSGFSCMFSILYHQ